ncbi:MAG: hypothetical protein OQK12_01160 [Motiliproteus sp.]|nr:hypothetical protein [Motiliproteus sp.]MCW9051559.1 hypothetical protein [Motiliproteus sp.]
MNISDPFGRMQKRRERDYISLRESLKEAGLTSRTAARELQQNMKKRCKTGLMIIAPFALLMAAIFPEAWMFSVLFGALICLWLLKTSSAGVDYVERYIKEELADSDDDPTVF